jgi:hypothetical protein
MKEERNLFSYKYEEERKAFLNANVNVFEFVHFE